MVLIVIVAMVNLRERRHGASVDLPPLRFWASTGATVDGAAKDEDDAQRTLLGSQKRSPYLAHQRCRGISAATYGTGWPLVGSAGGRRVAKRAEQHAATWQRAHKQFT